MDNGVIRILQNFYFIKKSYIRIEKREYHSLNEHPHAIFKYENLRTLPKNVM